MHPFDLIPSIQVTTEEARTKFIEQLTQMEDWLYMEGDGEGAAEYKARLAQMKAIGEPMRNRAFVSTGKGPGTLVREGVDGSFVGAGGWGTGPWGALVLVG